MRRTRRSCGWIASVVACIALLAGCTNPLEPQRDELEAARARWAAADIDDYTFELRRQCYCGPDYTQPVTVRVEGGSISGATYSETGEPFEEPFSELYTIDDLFAVIRDAIEQRVYALHLEFDEELGYPVDIWIDYRADIADDERGFVVSDFGAG